MNDAQDSGRFQQLGECARRKTWDERGVEEKIELLRDLLRSKDLAIKDLREQVASLMDHRHDAVTGEPTRRLWSNCGAMPMGQFFDPLA